MKQLFIVVLLFAASFAQAQNSGKGFNYQAVARAADGEIKSGTAVEVQFGLYADQVSLTPDWQESHTAVTDSFGVFSLTIGKGAKTGGSLDNFTKVDFSKYNYWLKVELKDNNVWETISKTQLLSVPYAEYAGNTEATPVGAILPFAGTLDKVPSGWLPCNGAAVEREKYPRLYDVIGTAWGAGDGSTTFDLPDFSGMFLRGVDVNTNNDPDRDFRTAGKTGGNSGNKVGSYQGDEFTFHKHFITQGSVETGGSRDSWGYPTIDTSVLTPHVNSNSISNAGGSETRPKNAYVHYIIKY